ncbi:hypothetical protein LCGC14_1627440 [marine sediment metagenome]|uniref:ParB-like N-terminal domain-containing protein n=1 Tax=marine sediment metagenome TaxID=412755 RepID=A0A0F9I3Y8_9ZZZZ
MPVTLERYQATHKKHLYNPKNKGKFMLIEPGEIDHDVPVDKAHVAALKQSIKAVGQLTPILVRRSTAQTKGELLVIDGFHRVTAMKELGMTIAAMEIDCDDDDFWATRIVSATQHEGVKTDRAALWVNELWNASPYTTEHKNVAGAIQAVDKGKADPMVQELVNKWIKAWGVTPKTLRNWVSYGTSNPEPKTKIAVPTAKPKLVETKPKEPEIHATMKAYYGNLGIVIEGSRSMKSDNMTKQEIKEYLIRMAETIEALKLAMKALGGK